MEDESKTSRSATEAHAADNAARSGEERLWTPTFVLIILATLGCFMVGQGANSGTSVYLAETGGTATLAGIGAAVFSGAAAASRILCGPVIDTRGRVTVMVAGAVVLLVGTLGPVVTNHDAAFIVWRLLQGFGFAACSTAAATAAADVLPLSRLGEGIGYAGLGQAIAMSIGPAVALFLVSTDPHENLYLGLSLFSAMAIVFSIFCRYEKNPGKLPATSAYRRRWEHDQAEASGTCASNPEDVAQRAGGKARFSLRDVFETKALPGTIPQLVLSPAFGFGIFFIGLFGTSLDLGNAGLFYTVAAVAMVVVRLRSKTFMDTVAPIKIITVAVACGLVAYAMLLACGSGSLGSATETVFFLAGVPYGLSLGVALPINQTVAIKNAPAERWGATNALFQLGNDVGIGIASIVWGIVNDSFGFTTTILCVMGCIAASLLAAWICYPARDKQWSRKRAR